MPFLCSQTLQLSNGQPIQRYELKAAGDFYCTCNPLFTGTMLYMILRGVNGLFFIYFPLPNDVHLFFPKGELFSLKLQNLFCGQSLKWGKSIG